MQTLEEPGQAAEHLSQEEIKKRLAALQSQPAAPAPGKEEAPAPPAALPRYVQAAAVLAYYDPATIRPLPGTADAADTAELRNTCLRYLAAYSDMYTDSRQYEASAVANKGLQHEATAPVMESNTRVYKVYFTLKDSYRKAALQSLLQAQKVKAALALNPSDPTGTRAQLQSMLRRCLLGEEIVLTALQLEDLHALCKVADWLSGLPGLRLPPIAAVRNRIETIEMLTPLKHLTGIYVDGSFQSLFRGRKTELANLRKYVGVAPPKGLLETVSRIWDNLFSSSKNPLLVFGMGGIGKSTLLAQFILEHAEAHRKDRFPFVYLDFDRPQLDALQPETLLIEAARQLSIQYQDVPEIGGAFAAFYRSWNEALAESVGAGSSEAIYLRSAAASVQKELDLDRIESEFLSLARQMSRLEARPFVIVLDTFEEVQYRGAEYVRQLYNFMVRLREQHPLVRTIAAGRAPVIDMDVLLMELNTLDNEAATGYLVKAGVANEAEAKRLVSIIGGNPLTLKLAAGLAREFGIEDVKQARDQFATRDVKKIAALQLQGMLYRRILDHIHVPEVRKLAYPGMVLRRITPAVIREVLAAPCGLVVPDLATAETLFRQLKKEVSLVMPSDRDVLRHRPDVRKAMLQLIQESEKKDLVPVIHRAAVQYYQDKEGLAERAEEFYHRLSLDESPRDLEPRWMDGIQNLLLSNLDELPARAQAYLLGRAGMEGADLSIWENADMEDRYRHTARQVADLLNAGRAEGALNLLPDTLFDKGSEVLTMLKVRALYQLRREDEAAALAKQALGSYYAHDYDPSVAAELQRFATMPEVQAAKVTYGLPPDSLFFPGAEPSNPPPPNFQIRIDVKARDRDDDMQSFSV
ncbi:hypothetical protein DCC81_13620 [Chitinophaga parva]|uniref:Orc1-like AAA ATPase domain-containing protein n=1 Tax=Chitinophaga parva TaxID=2169414 RepID=A0A2T7BGD1_9BACT|nr:ATP-binding protein [Chitinophaga parva]PUZ25337.1 hypothetical protein DCC81_13620 [Chitinophaga parva]